MRFREEMMGRNFYYARREPNRSSRFSHVTRHRWRLPKIEPDRWGHQRRMGTRIGCLDHDSQRVVRYRLWIGKYRTIQYPDLQQYWMECGR